MCKNQQDNRKKTVRDKGQQSSRKVQAPLQNWHLFSFCPAKTFSLSDKCPVILSKEINILTTNMLSVLQILICPGKDYSQSDSCPASVGKISRRLGQVSNYEYKKY